MSRWRLMALPVGVLVLLGSTVVYTGIRFRETDRRAAREQVYLVAEQSARRLEDYVHTRFLVLEVVRDEIATGLIPDQASFTARTSHLQHRFEGFQAINWMDAHGVIRWTSPEGPNRAALGRDVHDHPVAGPVLSEVDTHGQPAMTPPLELFQGGRAVTTYWPVRDSTGLISGFVNGVFRTDPLVSAALASTLERFALQIDDEGALVYGDETPEKAPTSRGTPVTAAAQLTLADRRWTLRATPSPELWATMTRDNYFPFLLSGMGMALAISIALASYLEHVDQRRREAEERRKLERQLGEAQKMEAIGRLAGGVAHDFNNLVTAILGCADLLLLSPQVTPRDQRLIDQVISTCERAAKLTGQLLTFSRRQLVEHLEVNVGTELSSLAPLLERLTRDDISVEIQADATPGVADLSPGQFGQVVLNLFVNAMDAMAEGGQVHIVTRAETTSPAGTAGPWAVLTVRDSGEGIDPALHERIFEPFFTTKGKDQGTGLGLSTVQGIITKAGGQIQLSSRTGGGCTFDIWLPTREASEALNPNPDSTALPAREGPPVVGKVLLVEDQPEVRSTVAQLLRATGIEVCEATDGEHALELVEKGECFDWVVTDAVMPRLGGIPLLRRLRLLRDDFGAVLCSGYAVDITAEDLAEIRATFLSKPFSTDQLLDALARNAPEHRVPPSTP